MRGSGRAPSKIIESIRKWSNQEVKVKSVAGEHIWEFLDDGFEHYLQYRHRNATPIVLGGDHTIAIASVSAGNEYSRMVNETFECLVRRLPTSTPWKHLHRESSRCRHRPCVSYIPSLSMGVPLHTNQFAYYGVRDMDTLEFERLRDNDMTVLDSKSDVSEWAQSFDNIHGSFDMDCFDPSVTSAVNTPVQTESPWIRGAYSALCARSSRVHGRSRVQPVARP